ncbi:hypothetical protein [Streptosporangium lutulentum]|uniref:Uncharacterized protein n=1 Tax=Streptosporangium lutulentum TaxID=1461250 RepID=A0ABT9Q801_9ACTN|nr:hypothetical protein [Streptosporangium lutulentum]MDP9842863.1 hypothetical protein [Streptosporangium lutulentum]
MANRKELTWQPISMLEALAQHVEESVIMVREQRAILERGRATPSVLDDATVARVKRTLTQMAADNELFAEQGRRWAAEDLTPARRDQVERYAALVAETQNETTEVLALADDLAKGAIETVLTKSDIELGIEAFLHDGKH